MMRADYPVAVIATCLCHLVSASLLCTLAAGAGAAAAAADIGSSATLDEVRIEGDRYSSEVSGAEKIKTSPIEIPRSISVITQQRIEDQNLLSVADALQNVTGVTVISNTTGQSQYRSRGYPLAVMNDGVPAYSALSGYQQLDLAIYERVEVLRGPAGVLQGTGDPGGTVNLVRKRGGDHFALSGSLGSGSWDSYRGTLDLAGPLDARSTLRARTVAMYQNRHYFQNTTADSMALGYATVDWDATPSTILSLAVAHQKDDITAPYSGLPSADTGALLRVPRSTSLSQSWEKDRWRTNDYTVSIEQALPGKWSARLIASQRDQNLFFHDAVTWDPVRLADNTVPYVRREYSADYRRQAIDLFFSGPFEIFGGIHHLLVGYNYDKYRNHTAGISLESDAQSIRLPFDHPELLPDFDLPYNDGSLSKTAQQGLYAQARVSASRALTLILGLRSSNFDSGSQNVAPAPPTSWRQGNKADSQLTPSAGVVYDVSGTVSLYASYADIFIPQSTLSKSDGASLDPRTGRQFELGAKGEFFDGKLQTSLAVFRLRDQGRALADPLHRGFFANSGEVESKGWEAEVSGSPYPGYSLQMGYGRLDSTYLRSTASTQGLVFDTLEPRHSLKLWGVRQFGLPHAGGLTLGLGLNYQSATQAGLGTSAIRSQGGFAVTNALLAYQFTPKLAINLNASNIFDKTYYTRLGPTNIYNTFGDPRSIALTLRGTY